MPLWTMNCHVVWATKRREPVLVGETAELVRRSLVDGCSKQGIVLHALFLMPDHVHLAVSIPPGLAVATLVSRLKGSSSHLIRHAEPNPDPSFAWQSEYGVVAFGEKQLPDVVAYVENQPARHKDRTTWSKLEQDCDNE